MWNIEKQIEQNRVNDTYSSRKPLGKSMNQVSKVTFDKSLRRHYPKYIVVQKSLSTIFSLLFALISLSLSAIDNTDSITERVNDAPQSVFERLSEEEILSITIRTDLNKLIENKKEKKYQLAYMSFDDEPNASQWQVSIKARGKFRNKVCDFPPIKIKFDHSVLGSENLKSYKSLKLVTHCGDQAEAEELLQKEYLAYKIYNTITDKSLRVQLVKVTWIDKSGIHEIGEKWGFIIENEDEMAERIGGGVYDEFGVEPTQLNEANAANQALFQYMIGNADWDILNNKNINLVKSNSNSDIWVVPYDFDFSGLVDAPYAVSTYGVTSVKERVFLGVKEQEMGDAIALFKSKEKEILDVISSFSHMSRSKKNQMKRYIKSFYSSLDEPFKDPNFYQERLASMRAKAADKETNMQ